MFQVKDGDSIVLASESTRRVDILRSLGISFSIIPPDIDETRKKAESPREFVLRVAEEKARKVGDHFPEKWVIGADTIVVNKGKVLGKPKDEADAFETLKSLRGKWHKVITGSASLTCRKISCAATR